MKTRPMRIAALLTLTAGLILEPARAATLTVGDPAPKLQVGKWVQGEPVKEFSRDKVYVVEFWATWCGPCRVSIPHLNELHTKLKNQGLVVIGQDVWENDTNAVAPFVKKMGPQMTYRVALDDGSKMSETWMQAAGQEGIPAAFVVNQQGVIVWIGHPMKLNEELLQRVLAGKFDVKRAAADYEAQQQRETASRALWQEFSRHRQKEEWDLASATLAKIEKNLPEDERDDLGLTRFQLLLEQKQLEPAYKLAARLSEAHPEDAMTQNQLAWTIVTREDPAERDLELAEKIARRANEATQGNNPEVLDTLARTLFLKGRKDAAIELQKKAIQLAEAGRQKTFERTLDDYQHGRVPNEAKVSRLRRQLSRSLANKEWDQAQSDLRELENSLREEERDGLVPLRLRLSIGRKDYATADRLAGEWMAQHPDRALSLNDTAWSIAVAPASEKAELEVAEKIIRRADAATKGVNAEILDTLARLQFRLGQEEKAIATQEKAVNFAKDRRKTQFEETLAAYKEGKLPKPY